MPVEYRIVPELRLVVSRATGVVSEEELNAHYARLKADPAFDPTYQQIADARGVTDASAVRGDLPRRTETRGFAPGARRALIAPAGHLYGLARQHTTLAGLRGDTTEAFSTVDEAEAWLGLAPGASGLPRE